MAFGADRTVAVNLKATVNQYINPMGQAKGVTVDFGKTLDKTKKSVEGFGKTSATEAGRAHQSFTGAGVGIAAAGAAIGVAVGLAVKSFADFDKEMSNVRAVSGATAGEMSQLTDAALAAGAATK